MVVKIVRKFERFEFYVSAILIVIILLFSLNIKALDMVTTSVLSSLATLYFFTAFAPAPELPNPEKALFVQKLAGIGPAIALVGIMFAMLNWPGANRLLIGGGLSCVVCLFFSFALKINQDDFHHRLKKLRVRCFLLAVICAVFLSVSSEKLIEMGFKRVNQKELVVPASDSLNDAVQP